MASHRDEEIDALAAALVEIWPADGSDRSTSPAPARA
jgi:hypothetical protein